MASKYPYPSDVYVGDFVPLKLSAVNRRVWEKMVLNLLESNGVLGFINGDTPEPPVDAVDDHRDWKRTDELVRSWIVSTLPEDRHSTAMRSPTAALLCSLYISPSSLRPQPLPESNTVEGKCFRQYVPLVKAAHDDNWEEASKFFEQEPDAARAIITGHSETVLMIAVRSKRRNHFLKKLLDILSPEDLLSVNKFGVNIFDIAATSGNVEAVKLLKTKNPQLPYLRSSDNKLALHSAANYGHREVCVYLLTFFQENPPELELREQLFESLIEGGLIDLATSLLTSYPILALSQSSMSSPLFMLATLHNAFPSRSRFNYWQRLIYSSCRPELHSVFWEVAEKLVPQMKQMRENKLMHLQARQLLKQLCMEIAKLDSKTVLSKLGVALNWAVDNGVHEVIEEILDWSPSMVCSISMDCHNMFSTAVVNRHENVFNLIHQLESGKKSFTLVKDVSRNNYLHLAGSLGLMQKISLRAKIPCAALQMQRELQWFQEVEKYTTPEDKEARNVSNKTPAMLFTETHQEMVKEGEQWMKQTSTSCTIAAALIVTVVFAAAITVPGGNNSETNLPNFSRDSAFNVFAVSDALALFSSTSSLIMFLSIITSRFAEIDFLYSLPKRMIIGLGSLFLSIMFMMIAFAATLEIVFGHENSWILIPVIAFACVPITLFMSFQFPLLFDMINSTYGPGIFRKQSDRILF